jgi:hypothetical protein
MKHRSAGEGHNPSHHVGHLSCRYQRLELVRELDNFSIKLRVLSSSLESML